MAPAVCCIGHITIDHVITPGSAVTMPGGTAFYFSYAIANMPVTYTLVTALALTEMDVVNGIRTAGIEVFVLPSLHSVVFENKYGEDLNHRKQRVLQKAAPFRAEQLQNIHAGIFHLGPLLADDFSVADIRSLAEKGKVSLDVQGFLRQVENTAVVPFDWSGKIGALPFIDFLKANEEEAEVLTGSSDIFRSAELLSEWGAKEVIITRGSRGAVIFNGKEFFIIPAYQPQRETDATGCGDTFMAGYLFQRSQGVSIQKAGEFAAAMAALKIEKAGPFRGTEEEVNAVMKKNQLVSVLENR